MTPPTQSSGAPFLFCESAPPVCVSLYTVETLLLLSSFTTALLWFCAISRSPFLSARIPSALLPLTSHTFVHFCPAAITPGIAVTAYSAGGGGKVAGAAGAAAPAA